MNVVIVGPVPPPVDGRALATSWLIERIQNAGHHVDVVNTHIFALRKAARCLHTAIVLIIGRAPDRLVVVASGESGLATEAVILAASRIRGVPTSLVHHSAHYVRRTMRLLQLVITVGGPRLRHLVLDAKMGSDLAVRYGIDPNSFVVVDNAGLMPLPPEPDLCGPRSGIVHLSNLSVAKGLNAVLEVAERTGVSVRLIGSVTAEVSEILDDARQRGVPFETLGPRHGDEKLKALSEARCFLFLSTYHHEAQPLVLYEAVSAGCLPIVWQTGWIAEQMERLGLADYVLPAGDVDSVVRLVSDITTMDAASYAVLAARIRLAFEAHHEAAREQFKGAIA